MYFLGFCFCIFVLHFLVAFSLFFCTNTIANIHHHDTLHVGPLFSEKSVGQ